MQIRFRWMLAASAVAGLLAVARPVTAAPQAPPTGTAPPPAPTPEANAYLDAVRKGDIAAITKALDAGVPVDTPFRYSRTALSFAADRGLADVVKLLLERGANPDTPDSFYNQTPLGWASQPAQTRKPEHADVVRMLLAKGAKGRERAFAAAIGADDTRMVQAILEAGGLPPALLSESLARATKAGKADVVAVLERGGATMPDIPALSPAQLERYAGTYAADGRGRVVLSVKDHALVGTLAGDQVVTLSPRSETRFVIDEYPGFALTMTLAAERATSVTVVNPGGQSTVYTRVNP
jgi:hypothetical protein